MRVLVAPDSFKGSLTAAEAAEAMARGVLRACPGAQVDRCPLSDGGEGFVAVLGTVLGGSERRVTVTGPVGAPVSATYLLLADGTALIESAHVVGLGRVPPERRRALETTTRGVGEILLAALDAGAARVVIGLGGTATTDAGAGMAQAIGVRFGGVGGDVRGGHLSSVRGVDLRYRDPRLASTAVLSLTDVDAPLTGPTGAARRYAPQKGATPGDVERLEHALRDFTREVFDPGTTPGDGAAGGLGYGLRVFAGARRERGIDYVLSAVRFDERLNGTDLVLTGEGRLDVQSASGKVISGVVERAALRAIPVVAIAGSVDAGAAASLSGLAAAFALAGEGVSADHALAHAAALVEERAHAATRRILGAER